VCVGGCKEPRYALAAPECLLRWSAKCVHVCVRERGREKERERERERGGECAGVLVCVCVGARSHSMRFPLPSGCCGVLRSGCVCAECGCVRQRERKREREREREKDRASEREIEGEKESVFVCVCGCKEPRYALFTPEWFGGVLRSVCV